MKKLENLFRAQSVEFQVLDKKEVWSYQQQWRETYSRRLYKKSGKWTYEKFDWHVFSYKYTPHLTGDVAWNRYRAVCGKQYFILPNFNDGKGYQCESKSPINLSLKGFDLYICPTDMEWTYVHTHEEGWFGPFYSDKSMI